MKGRRLTAGLAIVAVLPLLYLGAYLVLLDPDEVISFSFMSGPLRREPAYRVGGSAATAIFRPANALDQWLRPKYWDARST